MHTIVKIWGIRQNSGEWLSSLICLRKCIWKVKG